MGARQKLNSIYIGACTAVSAVAGPLSWIVFAIALIAGVALKLHDRGLRGWRPSCACPDRCHGRRAL
jgi:hypothetical protein